MKTAAVLEMYVRLKGGKTVDRQTFADEFGVSERTFYRYVREIRDFFAAKKEGKVVYYRKSGAYALRRE